MSDTRTIDWYDYQVELKNDALVAFLDMAAAFERQFGYLPHVTDSYRPIMVQTRIFLERYQRGYIPRTDVKIWQSNTWYLKPGHAAAATPGKSKHGTGNALDLGSDINRAGTPQHRWMVEHSMTYGWLWPSWARVRPTFEPWHFEYQGGYIKPTPATIHPGTARPNLKELDMPVRIRHHSGAIYLVDTARGDFRGLDPTENSLFDRLKVPIVWDKVSDFERDQVRQLVRDFAKPTIKG